MIRLFAAVGLCFALVVHPVAAQQQGYDVRHYPRAALRDGAGGRVSLECEVRSNGRLDCETLSDKQPGHGFARAALRIARDFRIAPQTRDGQPTAGGRVRFCFDFDAGPPPSIRTIDFEMCEDLIS